MRLTWRFCPGRTTPQWQFAHEFRSVKSQVCFCLNFCNDQMMSQIWRTPSMPVAYQIFMKPIDSCTLRLHIKSNKVILTQITIYSNAKPQDYFCQDFWLSKKSWLSSLKFTSEAEFYARKCSFITIQPVLIFTLSYLIWLLANWWDSGWPILILRCTCCKLFELAWILPEIVAMTKLSQYNNAWLKASHLTTA